MGSSPSRQQIVQEVQKAFAHLDREAVVFHTDLLGIRFVQRGVPCRNNLPSCFRSLLNLPVDGHPVSSKNATISAGLSAPQSVG